MSIQTNYYFDGIANSTENSSDDCMFNFEQLLDACEMAITSEIEQTQEELYKVRLDALGFH